jgi:hypothetical protein
MKNRPLVLGITYSILVIIFKLIVVLGGYGLSKFGFFFSHVISVAAIAPFIYFSIQLTKADNSGYINGKDAIKAGLKMLVFAAIITSAYNYVEFEWKWKDLSIEYYNSQTFKDFLISKSKFKPEEYPKIISEAITELSAFKAVTGKLFILFFFSISVTFISSVFLKKSK